MEDVIQTTYNTHDKSLRVSIIVPCCNEISHISQFLNSVLTQDFAEEFEVIIADGMSNDGTRELIEKLAVESSNIRLVDNPERTTPCALNRAISVALGDIIVRMDVHTEYAPDYLNQCVTLLEKTGVENVGGPARTKATNYWQEAIQIAYHSRFAVGGVRFHNINYEGYVDTVPYGCWRKTTLEQFGLFDEELVRNQDDELNLRITRAGGKIWQSPTIQSWYYPRSSVKAVFQQYAQYGYWKVRVIQKHKIPASWRHLIPGSFVGSLIILAVLSLVNVTALWFFIGLITTYSFANAIATIITCYQPSRFKFLPLMPIVFAAYHFGYGYGFLRGMVDFFILRKSGGHGFTTITREYKG